MANFKISLGATNAMSDDGKLIQRSVDITGLPEGINGVAVENNAGNSSQGAGSVAVGAFASARAVAIGRIKEPAAWQLDFP